MNLLGQPIDDLLLGNDVKADRLRIFTHTPLTMQEKLEYDTKTAKTLYQAVEKLLRLAIRR